MDLVKIRKRDNGASMTTSPSKRPLFVVDVAMAKIRVNNT